MNGIKSVILLKTLILLLAVSAISGLCILLSAGTSEYWNAWACVFEFYLLESGLAIYLFRKDPDLLMKRISKKEKHKNQKMFTSIAYFAIALCILIIPGLDRRYSWSRIEDSISITFMGIMAIGFVFQYIIVKQNRFIFRTIEVENDQVVVDKRLYSIIRHPMYLFGMIIVISMPIILGSFYAFIILLIVLIPLFVMRIRNEEKLLLSELNGYKEYCEKVKFRLIPYIW